MQATYQKYTLNFKRPSGTSRGIITHKESWFLILEKDGRKGIGECGILKGLSYDDRPEYEEQLKWVCEHIEEGPAKLWEELRQFPSIQFGVEMAFRSLAASTPFLLFPSEFTRGNSSIPINGLVWMGEKKFMKEQIVEKIEQGFGCIKLKIGAIDFQAELDLLKFIRKEFSSDEIEIRVDANGAFSASEAMEKLKRLSDLSLHSIEQPVKAGQLEEMANLCAGTPLPIALDEELIGVTGVNDKEELIEKVKPQYLIFKPSLIGGIRGTNEWITAAAQNNVGWWITSALESNVGLNAIAQYTITLENKMPQGLGTGGLYTNNFEAPLEVAAGELWYRPSKNWNFNL
ncbi:o-succinylbenzoate synthase [Salinimicrobium oceani]|uniref:O-succinylbenzoate synthase n=1 Tax=Salinimicrobium oceani TaxID=2722702 RepID=A0ABX1CVM5_9FLAO|nr:o-succinylbenzoate synthase [Salinimicrobium oceani]NJW51404.1 o-succinylbenzoate synthase [Salinimicrobium oceani]